MSNSDPTLFERLAKVEPAKLARLLVELAAQDQTILEQVQFLLASGDTTAIAKAVRSTLRAWKRSPRFIHYQEAFAFGEQLDRLLDSVEDGLLGPDPALALDLLEEFLQSDRWILERVDDSAGCIGTAYRRACQLFARAAAGVASPAAMAERIALLVEKDDYGVRHSLLEHVPKFLDGETIARLVDRWRKQAAQGPGSRRDRMPLLRIETLAASTGDPQLYAEAALEGTSVKDQPVIGYRSPGSSCSLAGQLKRFSTYPLRTRCRPIALMSMPKPWAASTRRSAGPTTCASCASATFSFDPTPSGWSATWAALRLKNAPQPKT